MQRKKKRSVFNWSFFSSVLFSPLHFLLKDTRRDTQKKRERAEIRDDTAARETKTAKEQRQKRQSLSSPQKLLSPFVCAEREREKERERERKKESAKNSCCVERNVFFPLREKKKAHLSSHLISSHLCWKDYASRAAKRRKKRRRRRWWRRW